MLLKIRSRNKNTKKERKRRNNNKRKIKKSVPKHICCVCTINIFEEILRIAVHIFYAKNYLSIHKISV